MRTLVGAFFQLLVVGCLLNDVEDRDAQLSIREREGLRVGLRLCSTHAMRESTT